MALSLLLVRLLRSFRTLALDGFGGVVHGVGDAVDGLADEAFVGLVCVWCGHFDVMEVCF